MDLLIIDLFGIEQRSHDPPLYLALVNIELIEHSLIQLIAHPIQLLELPPLLLLLLRKLPLQVHTRLLVDAPRLICLQLDLRGT